MGDSFFTVFCLSRIERCIDSNLCSFARKSHEMLIFLYFFKMTNASDMKRFEANGASRVSDFHRVSPKMAWLRLCRITNESTETGNCY